MNNMDEDVTYIGSFEDAEDVKTNENKKQNNKKSNFKTNKRNKNVKKFISNTKATIFNKKIFC